MGDCGLLCATVWCGSIQQLTLKKATAPPPITIQSVAADDKSYAPASHLSLPAHTSSVQIIYSAVSLTDPGGYPITVQASGNR